LRTAALEAKAGLPNGVRRFLTAIAPGVRRTCRGVLGPGHPDLDDTIQECLVAALKALRNYRFDGDVRHYVTKITLRRAISAKRTNLTRWRNQDLLRTEPGWQAGAAIPPEWSRDEVDLVRRILDRLSGVQSEAVLMRIVLGFSVSEIATMTGVSQNTVKTRLRLGKDALRRDLKKSSLLRRWIWEKRP
jgi:RNA polymerase sigma factor (sigma-70 family)